MRGSALLGIVMGIIIAVIVMLIVLGIVNKGFGSLPPASGTNQGTGISSNPGPSTSYDSIISAAAFKYGVEMTLIKAVIKVESSFDPSRVSKKGAYGLMQLMPGTIKSLNDPGTPSGKYCKGKGMPKITDHFDPEQNINGGTCYLSFLLNRYNNNKELALAAYNAGYGRVDSCMCVPSISETQQYVRLVSNYYDDYSKQSQWTGVG